MGAWRGTWLRSRFREQAGSYGGRRVCRRTVRFTGIACPPPAEKCWSVGTLAVGVLVNEYGDR